MYKIKLILLSGYNGYLVEYSTARTPPEHTNLPHLDIFVIWNIVAVVITEGSLAKN